MKNGRVLVDFAKLGDALHGGVQGDQFAIEGETGPPLVAIDDALGEIGRDEARERELLVPFADACIGEIVEAVRTPRSWSKAMFQPWPSSSRESCRRQAARHRRRGRGGRSRAAHGSRVVSASAISSPFGGHPGFFRAPIAKASAGEMACSAA